MTRLVSGPYIVLSAFACPLLGLLHPVYNLGVNVSFPEPSALVPQHPGRAGLQLSTILSCLAHLRTHNPSCPWPISTSMELSDAWGWADPAGSPALLLARTMGWALDVSPCPVPLERIPMMKVHIPMTAGGIYNALNTWSTSL